MQASTAGAKMLITGATGLLGAEIARQAKAQGYEVYGLYRNSKKIDPKLAIHWVQGDVTEPQTLEKALSGMDYAIHCAGDTSYDLRDIERLKKINVDGVRAFYQAALKCQVKRIVHTSSVAALGMSYEGQPVDEKVAFNWPKDMPYMETKREGEDIALSFILSGLEVVVVNPATVLGPGKLNASEEQAINEVASEKAFGIPPGGMTVCHLEDVARGHLLALAKGRSGERYILGGPHITHLEFYQCFAKHLKVKIPRRMLPAQLLLSAGTVGALLEKCKLTLGIPASILKLSVYLIYHSSEKAQRELGYESRGLEAIVESVVQFRRAQK